MKILKYGDGYEPKVTTCEHCKSEIEYLDIDVQPFSYYYQGANGEIWDSLPDQDCICIRKQEIRCPVCNYSTTTGEERYKIYSWSQEPTKKKRWWQR